MAEATAPFARETGERNERTRALIAHLVEEFFLHDFAVEDGVEGAFFHGEALAGHGAGLGGDVVFEVDDEAVVVGPGAVDFGAVDGVVVEPALVFLFDGVAAFDFTATRRAVAGLDADGAGAEEGVNGLEVFALAAEFDESLTDFVGGGHGSGGLGVKNSECGIQNGRWKREEVKLNAWG